MIRIPTRGLVPTFPFPGESEGIPRVLWLHPSDRIVRRRVIPTRIEMLAEIRVWGRYSYHRFVLPLRKYVGVWAA